MRQIAQQKNFDAFAPWISSTLPQGGCILALPPIGRANLPVCQRHLANRALNAPAAWQCHPIQGQCQNAPFAGLRSLRFTTYAAPQASAILKAENSLCRTVTALPQLCYHSPTMNYYGRLTACNGGVGVEKGASTHGYYFALPPAKNLPMHHGTFLLCASASLWFNLKKLKSPTGSRQVKAGQTTFLVLP